METSVCRVGISSLALVHGARLAHQGQVAVFLVQCSQTGVPSPEDVANRTRDTGIARRRSPVPNVVFDLILRGVARFKVAKQCCQYPRLDHERLAVGLGDETIIRASEIGYRRKKSPATRAQWHSDGPGENGPTTSRIRVHVESLRIAYRLCPSQILFALTYCSGITGTRLEASPGRPDFVRQYARPGPKCVCHMRRRPLPWDCQRSLEMLK